MDGTGNLTTMGLFRRRAPGHPGTPGMHARRATTNQLASPNAVVAAATRIQRKIQGANGSYLGLTPTIRIPTEEWQIEAWRQYDLNSELHFATNWLANAVGLCRLTVVPVDKSGVIGPPTQNQQVLDLATGILDDPVCQHQILGSLAINLTVAGDAYIIGTADEQGEYDDWIVLSAKEVTIGIDGQVTVNRGGGEVYSVDTNSALVIRVHRPHPRCWYEADSPTRPALPLLRELEELSKYLFATINSRLAGAGILALPSEMSFPSPTAEITPGESPFLSTLTEAFLAPIEDMTNPAALVPVVIEAPRDALGGIQWLVSPNSGLPEKIESLRERCIARLAVVLDMDVRALTGEGTTNHWGEWAIEEQSIKFHVEPLMVLICSAFTEGFLRPSLEAAGLDPEAWMFWYDPADLINRPSKGVDAKDLYDRGELSGAALRRETGFSELDAPLGSELCARALLKILTLAPTAAPALLPDLIRIMGLEACGVDPKNPAIAQPDGTPPGNPPPPPNKDPKALPPPPAVSPTSPRKDGKAPEPNASTP